MEFILKKLCLFLHLKKDFAYLLLERGKGGRETAMCKGIEAKD